MYDFETFLREATQFENVSKALNANWQLRYFKEGDADSVYLLLKEENCLRKARSREIKGSSFDRVDNDEKTHRVDSRSIGIFDDQIDGRIDDQSDDSVSLEDAAELDLTETAIVLGGTSKRLLNCEYHVLYSSSYSVPALYFKIHESNGKALRLEEFWDIVPEAFSNATSGESKWKFVTQQEHPFLGSPFFHLHPCHTAEAMRAIRKENSDFPFLLSWFSCYGPFANLFLPNEFYTQFL